MAQILPLRRCRVVEPRPSSNGTADQDKVMRNVKQLHHCATALALLGNVVICRRLLFC
jgi:hypothetical protein